MDHRDDRLSTEPGIARPDAVQRARMREQVPSDDVAARLLTKEAAHRVSRRWPLISASIALVVTIVLAVIIAFRPTSAFSFDVEWMDEIVEHRSSVWDVPALIMNTVGAGIVGPSAGDLIAEAALAIETGADASRKARLVAEPLERGFGVTLGNSLRRVLLSSLQGAAVTAVQIDGVVHEFSSLEGVREDVVDIVLNIKQLALRMHAEGPKRMTLRAAGPGARPGHDGLGADQVARAREGEGEGARGEGREREAEGSGGWGGGSAQRCCC